MTNPNTAHQGQNPAQEGRLTGVGMARFNAKEMFPKHGKTLIIGDGDLSFAHSLHGLVGFSGSAGGTIGESSGTSSSSTDTGKGNAAGLHLIATVYDQKEELIEKYKETGIEKRIEELSGTADTEGAATTAAANTTHPVKVAFGVDVKRLDDYAFADSSQNKTFDRIIFQFPLAPPMNREQFEKSFKDPCLENRHLLLLFLLQCERLLKPGSGMAMITSKDVKPYTGWRLENCLDVWCEQLQFFGKGPFSVKDFPGYKCQNVSRDSTVKDTEAMTYYYGFPEIWEGYDVKREDPAAGVAAASSSEDSPAESDSSPPGYTDCSLPSGTEKETVEKKDEPNPLRTLPKFLLQAHQKRQELIQNPKRCHICETQELTSEKNMEEHLNSKTHRMMTRNDGRWKEIAENAVKEVREKWGCFDGERESKRRKVEE